MLRTSTSKERSRKLRAVDIYRAENADSVDLSTAQDYLKSYFPTVVVSIRPRALGLIKGTRTDEFSRLLALARVKDPSKLDQPFQPMYGEIEYERRLIEEDARAGGVVYDGRKLSGVFAELIPRRDLSSCSMVVTDRLISTFSRDDLRHHLRTAVFGFPSIISVPGIVEAPARPREYYILRQQLEAEGAGESAIAELKRSLKERFIDFEDPRIPDVMRGLVLQCAMFHLTLRPFCSNKGCMLYNSHWQEELIASEVTGQTLCRRHAKEIKELGRNPAMRW